MSCGKWNYCVQSQGHSKGSECHWMFVWIIFFRCVRLCLLSISWTAQLFSSFFYQTWYYCVLSWGDVSCGKIGSLSSMSRSQWGLIWSQYESFYYTFWINDSLATKLGLMIHHLKPECREQNWITAFKVKVAAKGQNVGVCQDNIF